jgi:hypothetical protein
VHRAILSAYAMPRRTNNPIWHNFYWLFNSRTPCPGFVFDLEIIPKLIGRG